MDTSLIVPIVARWAHVLAAVVAIGGVVFMRFVLMPAADEALDQEQHTALREKLIARWKIVVMACITLLLLSGTYNFMTIGMEKAKEVGPMYHALFGIKVLAALGVFFLASVLTGRSPAFESLRSNSKKWLAITAGLGILVVLISGVLSRLGSGG